MIMVLGADFWISLCCVGILFLGFSFLFGLSENVMVLYCLFSWPGMFTVNACIRGWVTGMNLRKEGWRKSL